jgi:DNA-binding GntR family transcriptional regulator
MVPGRIATSQDEHEGIMAALHDHDAERAARLALLHKRSVRDSVSKLVDRLDDAGQTARLQEPAAR